MIRFLQQKDSRIIKALFVVIIAAASVSMVVYLIPGLTGLGAASTGAYAVIYPHWYSKLLSSCLLYTSFSFCEILSLWSAERELCTSFFHSGIRMISPPLTFQF